MFLENKTLRQEDIVQGQGITKVTNDYNASHDDVALWNPRLFGGMPTYLVGLNYGGDAVLNQLQKVFSLWLPRPSSIFFKSMLCFYILLLVFQVRPYLAIAGAIAYGLSTFAVISLGAGHNWKVEAMAYMPLVLAGVHTAFTRNYRWGFALTALAMALEIRQQPPADHLLSVVYCSILRDLGPGLRFSRKATSEFFKTIGVLTGRVARRWGEPGADVDDLRVQHLLYSRAVGVVFSRRLMPADRRTNADRDYAFQWSNSKNGNAHVAHS